MDKEAKKKKQNKTEQKRKESIRKICILKLKPNAKCSQCTHYYSNELMLLLPFVPLQNKVWKIENKEPTKL